MKWRFLRSALFTCVLLSVIASSALAQRNIRPEQTLFIQPRVGLSSYVGDNDLAFFKFEDDVWDSKFPYSAAVELGYAFSPSFTVSGAYQVADYPNINPPPPSINHYDYTRRHTAQLLLRYLIGGRHSRVAPFLTVGGQGTVGYTTRKDNGDDKTGFGPVVGAGLDIALNDRTSLILEGMTNFVFPDEAADGNPDDTDNTAGFRDDFSSFDLLSYLGIGLKINFKSAFTQVAVLAIDGPTELETNQEGTFTASANENEATTPIEYRWDWGDGTTSTGLLATHTYTGPGTYNVTFTASNRASSDSQSMTVAVAPPPVPAEIVTISATPTNPTTQDQVSFSANVRGDAPVSYNWNFGDGATATGATPTHTYSQPGTYTVTLDASNQHGTDSRTTTVTVSSFLPPLCMEITEMNSVFFDRNSSTLTDQARATLQENVEILNECSNLTARVEGYAAPGERNTQQLSEDRARAVEQFYTDNGVPADRINSMGMGRVQGVTSKKDGASQYRRVDTIPLRQ